MMLNFIKYFLTLFLLLQAGISFSRQSEKDTVRSVYTTAEQMPSFPGGHDALSKYINKHLRYPKQAMKEAIQGKVLIRFVVEADGSISGATILKGLDKECDAEALRVIKGMPKWDPGMQSGSFVAVYYNLPITFAMF